MLPLWGQLQKATDDPSTIEQAVAAAIAAHEQDPTAHLGEGESLSVHKHEQIIDHPQGSVLPDKVSFSDVQFDTTFESLANFTKSSHVGSGSWPGCTIDIYDGGADIEYIRMSLLGIIPYGLLYKDVVFDTYFYSDYADGLYTFNAGIGTTAMTTNLLGFRVSNNQIYGVARWDNTEHVTSPLFSVPPGVLTFVRVFYDSVGGIVYFYVNGVHVGSLFPSSNLNTSQHLFFRGVANSSEGTVIRIYRTTFSISL